MVYQFEYNIKTTKKINDVFNGLLTLDVGGYKSPVVTETYFKLEDIEQIIKDLYNLDLNDKVEIFKVSKSPYNIIWNVVTEDFI